MKDLKNYIEKRKSVYEEQLQNITDSEKAKYAFNIKSRIDTYDEILKHIESLESANKNEFEIKGVIARDRDIHKYFKTNLFMYEDDVNLVYDEEDGYWCGDGTEWALPMEAFPEVKASDKGYRNITITITLD